MHIDYTTIALILAILFLLLTGYIKFGNNRRKEKEAPEADAGWLSMRLQAYERLILLMERINPQELVMRYAAHAGTVADLQLLLLSTIRSETEYNYAQQLYVSNKAWQQVMAARNAVSALVNQAATALQPEEPAIALSHKIIELYSALNPSPTATAIKTLKFEARVTVSQK